MIIVCQPRHFHPVHWDQTTIIVCQSIGSRPIQAQELFTLVPHLFGTTSCCLSVKLFQLLPSRNIWRNISLTWPFPHRHRHDQCPVDVTELFLRFWCWTLIRLSCATESGFAWDMSAIEFWLIEYFIFHFVFGLFCFKNHTNRTLFNFFRHSTTDDISSVFLSWWTNYIEVTPKKSNTFLTNARNLYQKWEYLSLNLEIKQNV